MVPPCWFFQDMQGNAQGPYIGPQMQLWFSSNYFNGATMVLPIYQPFESNPTLPPDASFEPLEAVYPLLASSPDLTFVSAPSGTGALDRARAERDAVVRDNARAREEDEVSAQVYADARVTRAAAREKERADAAEKAGKAKEAKKALVAKLRAERGQLHVVGCTRLVFT